jgi:hypothetical protein
MQLVEIDRADGVRAAVVTMASDASSLRFVLVPLAPLAEAAHYDAVRARLRSCDLVVIARAPGRHTGALRVLGPDWRFFERLASGPHIRLAIPPDTWEGVDRPFVQALDSAAGDVRLDTPRWLGFLDALARPVAIGVRKLMTREVVGDVLAIEADQALRDVPADRGLMRAATRHGDPVRLAQREGLIGAVRGLHAERQGQDLRVAVVHWVTPLPAVARALGALGYMPGEPEWIPVFGWLPGEAPSAPGPPGRFERLAEKVVGAPSRPGAGG